MPLHAVTFPSPQPTVRRMLNELRLRHRTLRRLFATVGDDLTPLSRQAQCLEHVYDVVRQIHGRGAVNVASIADFAASVGGGAAELLRRVFCFLPPATEVTTEEFCRSLLPAHRRKAPPPMAAAPAAEPDAVDDTPLPEDDVAVVAAMFAQCDPGTGQVELDDFCRVFGGSERGLRGAYERAADGHAALDLERFTVFVRPAFAHRGPRSSQEPRLYFRDVKAPW